MSKFRIEIQITVVTIIIAIVVTTIGYFSYQSLSKIVYSIQQGIQPNDELFKIKEIASDLTALEQAVRIYVLTGNPDDLQAYYSLEEQIAQNFKALHDSIVLDNYDVVLVDSLSKLSQAKIDLWQEIFKMQLSTKNNFPAYSEIYSNPEKAKADSIKLNAGRNKTKEKKTGGDSIKTDLIQSETPPELKTVRRKLLTLEWEIYNERKQRNELESKFIEKNILIEKKINDLIKEAEIREANSLLEKTKEVNRLAEITYERLALYSISAVFLLFVALLVLFNYFRKTRATQRALANAREKAEALALAKEQFAASVSHELRTPLNAIYGLTEQVLQKKLDSDTSEMVSAIFKSADHLRNIVNDTLDFSKIQAGKIVIDSIHFSPAEIFEEVFTLFKHEASKKGIKLSFNREGEKPTTLIGDPLRLKQIVINLVGNAIKFTEKGEVAINVKCVKSSDGNYEMEIRVIDTGIGISEKNLNFIFDEYVKIENATGKKYSGTGLGLSIVKKLVELQGGKIKLESNPGKGTTVTVNINYSEGDSANLKQLINEAIEIPESFKKLSVLIADDEEFNRFLLKSILQKWGLRFKEAKNGIEVVNAARNEHFDLILMDLNMPEMNGIEAAKAVMQSSPDIIIVAVTAANDEADQQACFKAGMKGFLFKPFSEKDLFEKINSVIRSKSEISQSADLKNQLNISEFSRLAGGDDKFLAEMIQLFIKSMESGITGIEDAIKTENWNAVFENAHKMAAPLKHIGASHLYEKIKHLEKISHETATIASVTPVFREIKFEIEELNSMLKSYIV